MTNPATSLQPPAPVTSSAPAPDTERAAEAAYQDALSTYAKGDIRGAWRRMGESYRLSQRPELLYNLARLESELQDCRAALGDYDRYLAEVPQGRYRQAAEQASGDLARQCPVVGPAPVAASIPEQAGPTTARAASPVATQGAAVDRPARYWTPPRVLGWSAIAAGVLAEGGTLYFTLKAKAARDDDQANENAYHQRRGATRDLSLREAQHRDQTAARALGIAGGALVAGGAVLILGPRANDGNTSRAFLDFQPGGVRAGFSHSF